MLRLASLASLASTIGLLAACRTDLDALRGPETEGTGAGTPSGSTGGGPTELPPPPCNMVSAGDAAEIMGFPDRHAATPSIRVADDGATERVFVQAFAQGGSNPAHPDIQLSEHRIGSAWPQALQRVSGPVLQGIEAHSWGLLTPSPASRNEMTLAWYGDPGGYSRPMLRRLDLVSGAVSNPVDLAQDGEIALDLVAGADGYAVGWRRHLPESPDFMSLGLALLDLDGVVRAGPFPLSAPHPYPGLGVSLGFTGSVYLAAIAFGSCVEGDTLCQENAVVIAAVDPGTGAAQVAAAFPVSPLVTATRPALGTWGGRTYVVWAEGTPDVTTDRVVRLAELTASGAARVGPIEVEVGVEMLTRPAVAIGEPGISIAWVAPGDRALPPEALGYDNVVLTHLDHNLLLQTSRATAAIPAYSEYGPAAGATLRSPRGAVFVVSARLDDGIGHDGAYATRFDCE